MTCAKKVSESLVQIELVQTALEQQAEKISSLSRTASEDMERLNGSINVSNTDISRITQTTISDLAGLEDKLTNRMAGV